MMDTQTCVLCGKPAWLWSGHVHRGAKMWIAGLCKRHQQADQEPGAVVAGCPMPHGCFGRWTPRRRAKA